MTLLVAGPATAWAAEWTATDVAGLSSGSTPMTDLPQSNALDPFHQRITLSPPTNPAPLATPAQMDVPLSSRALMPMASSTRPPFTLNWVDTPDPDLAFPQSRSSVDSGTTVEHRAISSSEGRGVSAQLESPAPQFEVPWVFHGNGAQGVKTWLSDCHLLEINPAWLCFDHFESLALDMIEEPPAPGEPEPQEWRSIFTVGVAADWFVRPNLAFHAGYRFYANPIPADMLQGAYLNADQHVVALGLSLGEGPHSLSMVYGLDLMDSSSAVGVSSARHGANLPELGHLVTFSYAFSF